MGSGKCVLFLAVVILTQWPPPARALQAGALAGQDDSQDAVSAVPPPMVDVLDADRRWPVHYQVPRADLPAMIARKAILAESSTAEKRSYRFVSAEAAAAWFAGAGPIVPPPIAAKGELVEVDWRDKDAVTFFSAGRHWLPTNTYRYPLRGNLRRKVEEFAGDRRPYLDQAEALLLDRQNRLWILSDRAGGLWGFDLQGHQWIERKNLPPEKPPKDRRDACLVPRIIGPAYESRSGLLFFGDQMGVHVFDGHRWQFQKLYQRNIDEDRFDPDILPRGKPKPPGYFEIRRFSGPAFSEDSQGRVYVWTEWGYGGAAGTIGFWVYERGNWKNVDEVDHLLAVIPHDPDEIWLISRGPQADPVTAHPINTLSVIKGGRHITGDEAQRLLVPKLRFANVWNLATGPDGTAFLLLEDVFDQDSHTAAAFRGVALHRQGPAVDLGNAAGKFLKTTWGLPRMVDSQGRVWSGTEGGLTAMSPDGRQIISLPITRRLSPVAVIGFDGPDVYFSNNWSNWRFDPRADRQSADVEPLLPAEKVSIRGHVAQDSLGRIWCVWDIPDAPLAVFDGRSWEPRLDPDVRSRPREYVASFLGADGAMVFIDDNFHFHLFDAAGHAEAESAESLALQNGDRLRKALPYPPRGNLTGDYHLLKDAKGRIWWADWHRGVANRKRFEGWGIVDGKTAIRGPLDDLKGKAPGGRIRVLHPIGDGTRQLLAFLGHGPAASGVYGVENDRILRLADSPVSVVPFCVPNVGFAGWADQSNRLWIMRDRDPMGQNPLRPVSQAVDRQSGPGVTHEGWLVSEDQQKALWFADIYRGRILRQDAGGRESQLDSPKVRGAFSFAASPNGLLWALAYPGLCKVRSEGDRLSIVEQYPVEVQPTDHLWCDREGRVWMVHTHVPAGGRGNVYTELIRFATRP